MEKFSKEWEAMQLDLFKHMDQARVKYRALMDEYSGLLFEGKLQKETSALIRRAYEESESTYKAFADFTYHS